MSLVCSTDYTTAEEQIARLEEQLTDILEQLRLKDEQLHQAQEQLRVAQARIEELGEAKDACIGYLACPFLN